MGKWESGTSINKINESIDCFALETPLKKRDDGRRHPSSSSEDTSMLIGSHSNSGTYNDMSKRSFSKAVNNETSEVLINKHVVAGVHLGMQDEKILSLSTPDLPIPLLKNSSFLAAPTQLKMKSKCQQSVEKLCPAGITPESLNKNPAHACPSPKTLICFLPTQRTLLLEEQ